MLEALYDGNSKYFKRGTILPFPVVATFLSLGSKYQIEFLRQEAVSRLEKYFPSQLANYPSFFSAGIGGIDIRPDDAIAVVDIARTYGLPCLLPTAFYTCCQLHTDTLVDGTTDVNGKVWSLCREDLKKCLNTLPELRDMVRLSLYPLFCTGDEYDFCDSCKRLCEELAAHLIDPNKIQWPDCNPLLPFKVRLAVFQDVTIFEKNDICADCWKATEVYYDFGRIYTWASLPSS